jgi:phosphoheptose isomerase
MSLKNYLEESVQVIQATAADDALLEALNQAIRLIVDALSEGLPVLVCGNGA